MQNATNDPILLAVLSASCYGAWALLQKLSSEHILPQQVQLCTAATSALFAFSRWLGSGTTNTPSLTTSNNNNTVTRTLAKSSSPSSGLPGFLLAVASGLGSFTGTYFFTQAIGAGGDVGIVSAISATYPAMAYLFSLILTEGETVQLHKVVGIVFAILSAVAFAYEPPKTTTIGIITEHIKTQ